MRVDIVDITLCGAVSFAAVFGAYSYLGLPFQPSPEFFTGLYLATVMWMDLINGHPNNQQWGYR